MKNIKKYYLGIDAGTDSVGYAVTDEAYSLVKFHGEPMWGVSLFDEAELNTERRSFRTARRRTERKRQRISLLQELFATEIAKVDGEFFKRLKASSLYRDDCEEQGSLFPLEGELTDISYHKQYRTVHHLIIELMTSDEPHDIRLVYLACAWLVSHRGHFLNDINAESVAELTDFFGVFNELTQYIMREDDSAVLFWQTDKQAAEQIGNVLTSSNTVTGKYRELCLALFNAPKAPKTYEGFPYNPEVFIKLLCGSIVKAYDLFGNEEYSDIESFALNSDDDKLADILSRLGDSSELIIKMKAVFDCALLSSSLKGCETVSEAKVATYNRHQSDLKALHYIVKKYAKDKYGEIFNSIDGNGYTAYTGHCKNSEKAKLKKVGREDFNDFIRKILTEKSADKKNAKILDYIELDEEDRTVVDDIDKRLNMRTFLPKQKDGDNRVIPHQLYLCELKQILAHAAVYLPFLNEADEKGISVADKIISVFLFRIPYYVGPLNPYSKEHSWVVFKKDRPGKIYPWNFADCVDEDASEQEFIRRMTNKCTYLPGEDVLPKESLLYHRYTVLNEINVITINGERISVEAKQGIYNGLFMKRRRVTVKAIKDYLLANGYMDKNGEFGGIDETVKSDLKPWLDFHNLMQAGTLTEAQVEDIIEHRTYSEEKPRFVKWLRREYSFLPEEDIAYISKLKYKDFGRLSRRFLDGICGSCLESPGENASTVIRCMWENNLNLMELLSDKYDFKKIIDDERNEFYGNQSGSLNDRLEEMRIPNSVKRTVIRTLEIVKEVTKALGAPPAKIFVEMARGGKPEEKGKRTKSRYEQILECYKHCRDEDVKILREQLEAMGVAADSRLQSDRLFLYYMQLGKCMYSGEAISLNRLSEDYNIDHIYPQAFIKDDSIINNKVLVKSTYNGRKDNEYPIPDEWRHNMAGFWAMLKANKLISEEKYKRLTRNTPFTDDEKLGFINRQITETRQSTKAIATLLGEYYPDSEVVYVKARLASEFRQEFDLLKSRTFNDLHHAKDAYLNIVAGNVYNTKFTKNFYIHSDYSIKTETVFGRPLEAANWLGEKSIAKVKAVVQKNNAHITKYAFCRHGGFFDQMPVKAAPGLIPLKKGMPTEKYGGYNKPTVTFFVFVKYQAGKKTDTMLMPVELLHCNEFLSSEENAVKYAKTRIGHIINKEIDNVLFPLGMRKIKVNTVLSLDGFRVCVSGGAGGGKCVIVSPFMPFSADHKWEIYIKRLEMLCEKVKNSPNYVFNEFYDKVTAEQNTELYSVYIDKLEKKYLFQAPQFAA